MNIPRIIFGAAFMLVFYGGTNFYIGRRVFQWLRFLFPHVNAPAYTVVFALFALSPVLGGLVKGIFNRINAYWMGVFVYLLLFFLLADCVLLIVRLLPFARPAPERMRFYAGTAAIALAAGFTVFGVFHARHIDQVSYTLPVDIRGGMKIVLISDLHLGAAGSERRLESVVREINQHDADIVCIAGDMFNNNYYAIRDPDRAAALLKGVKSKYGVYACLGNHDAGGTFDQMAGLLARAGVKLLNDESVVVDGRMVLAGRVDGSPIGGFGGLRRKPAAEFLAPLKAAGLPVVVMDHSPSHVNEYGGETDLVLCGHTHKGQIFPGNLFTRAMYTVDYGRYRKDGGPDFIVTSGAGTWGPPMRVGTNCEVAEINLKK